MNALDCISVLVLESFLAFLCIGILREIKIISDVTPLSFTLETQWWLDSWCSVVALCVV